VKRLEKEVKVTNIRKELLDASSVVFLDYRGLDVDEITQLRNQLRTVSVELKVIKNTLTKLAAEDTHYEAIQEFLKGPTAIAVSTDDPVAGFKILNEFAKINPKLKYKIGVIEGQTINQGQMVQLADLPPKEVMLGQLLATMQAPVSGLVRLFSGSVTGLFNVLNGIKDSRA